MGIPTGLAPLAEAHTLWMNMTDASQLPEDIVPGITIVSGRPSPSAGSTMMLETMDVALPRDLGLRTTLPLVVLTTILMLLPLPVTTMTLTSRRVLHMEDPVPLPAESTLATTVATGRDDLSPFSGLLGTFCLLLLLFFVLQLPNTRPVSYELYGTMNLLLIFRGLARFALQAFLKMDNALYFFSFLFLISIIWMPVDTNVFATALPGSMMIF